MIAKLRGILTDRSEDHAVIDVGGVGYRVFVSQTSRHQLPEEGLETTLHIYTHVREDQITLFGFASKEEKMIFLRLLNVSGVGPKMALSILSGMKPHDIVDAVVKEDLVRLHSIPGIGRKTAERIVVDLKDKFLKEFAGIGATPSANRPLYNDALSALVNLGYQRATVEKVFVKIGVANLASVQAIVKESLRELGQKRGD